MATFRLDGSNSTLLLLQRDDGMPEVVHWGARLPTALDLDGVASLRDRAPRHNGLDEDHVEAVLMPTLGTGTMRAPGLLASRGGVDWTASFDQVTVQQGDGSLRLSAQDPACGLGLDIILTLPANGDLLRMRTRLRNDGETPLQVARLAAGIFLLPAEAGELLVFDGRWGGEFAERRIALSSGLWASENRRGRSHDRFPGLIAGEPGFDEDRGLVFGVHLGWSGNHRTTAERLEDGRIMIGVGEWLHPGEVILGPGESLESPIAYASLSLHGLSGLSRHFHEGVRRHVLRWPDGRCVPAR